MPMLPSRGNIRVVVSASGNDGAEEKGVAPQMVQKDARCATRGRDRAAPMRRSIWRW